MATEKYFRLTVLALGHGIRKELEKTALKLLLDTPH